VNILPEHSESGWCHRSSHHYNYPPKPYLEKEKEKGWLLKKTVYFLAV
jgi:hypothetical protein